MRRDTNECVCVRQIEKIRNRESKKDRKKERQKERDRKTERKCVCVIKRER